MLVRLSPWPHHYKTPPLLPHNCALSNSFRVQYLLANKVPNSRTTARSKHAVPRLLDRLARDAMQPARIEGYIKIVTMLGYGRFSHSWKVDILIGSTNANYNNQLDWSLSPSSLFSYHPPAMLNTPARLSLNAYIFLMEVSIYEVSETIAPP